MKRLPQILLEHNDAIRRLFADLAVRELRAFGSVVTEHFDPSRSDLDFLVDFHEPDKPGIFDRYMALADGLERIFQRPVDLITKQAMKNPVSRQTVDSTRPPSMQLEILKLLVDTPFPMPHESTP